jgi:hypothetical protein
MTMNNSGGDGTSASAPRPQRDPFVPTPDATMFIDAAVAKLIEIAQRSRREEGKGMILVGRAGAGKSATLRALRRKVNDLFKTQERQSPIISLTMPSPCTVRAISIEMRRAFGDKREASTVIANMDTLKFQFNTGGTDAVCLDEFHNIGDDRGDVATSKKKFIKNAMNMFGGLWIIAGTPGVEDLVSHDKELDRRFRRIYHVHTYDWSIEGDRIEWRGYLHALDKRTGMKISGLSLPDMAYKLIQATGGRRGICHDLINEARAFAIESGHDHINEVDLRDAFFHFIAKGKDSVANPFSTDVVI